MSESTPQQPAAWATLTFTLATDRLVELDDALTTLAPDGMQIDDGATMTGKDLKADQSRVVLYVPAEQRTQAEIAVQVLAASHRLSLEVIAADLVEQDWNAQWKAHYRPLRIGRRLRIEPIFDRCPPDPDLVTIIIDPGMAFGTGTHATTQLAAIALEAWVDGQIAAQVDLSEETFLDVGTGSGILSIAAIKLGFGRAVGTEIDGPGLENTHDNVVLNGVDDRMTVHLTDDPASLNEPPCTLVLANMISSILLRLRSALIACTTPGGTLIVSGIMAEERDGFHAAFQDPQLTLVDEMSQGEWMLMIWRRN